MEPGILSLVSVSSSISRY